MLTYFSDFGVFGFDETYNQHRLNDINEANLKLVCTHCGLDVGEDGKTHQCLDYVGTIAATCSASRSSSPPTATRPTARYGRCR